MATEWTQFSVRLGALLLAPIVVLVLLNPRPRPAANPSDTAEPRAPVEEASAPVEDASGPVLPGAERAFWAPYSSGSGSMKFETRTPVAIDEEGERPNGVSDEPRPTKLRLSALDPADTPEESLRDRSDRAEDHNAHRDRRFAHRLHLHRSAHRIHPAERKQLAKRT